VRRRISRSLPVIAAVATLLAVVAAGPAAASKCTRAESRVAISKRQLKRDKATLSAAKARLRRHPHSAAAKRNLARAQSRVRADNRALTKNRLSFEELCLPGY
jgi:hypothetical protein